MHCEIFRRGPAKGIRGGISLRPVTHIIYRRNWLRFEFFPCSASLLSLSEVSSDGREATAGLYQLQSYTGRALFPVTRNPAAGIKQDRQCMFNDTLTRFRLTFVSVEKQCYIFWVYACSFIQHAKRMRLIVLYVACPAVPYFSTLSYKRRDFRKKKKSCWT